MAKLTIITGPRGCGKTQFAHKYCLGKNAIWCVGVDYEKIHSKIQADTDIIVLDDLVAKDIPKLKMLATSESVFVPEYMQSFKTPEILAISIDKSIFGDIRRAIDITIQ